MDSVPPGDTTYLSDDSQTLVKIVVAGPFGVGKTTMIDALSETTPLHTEEIMTEAGALVDDLAGVESKRTTTVAIDFGRRTLSGDLVLYLFGAPGQRRFKPLWEDVVRGALGALVLVDTRRLGDSFEVIDMIEEQGLTYAVAVNVFPDTPGYPVDVVRDRLDLAEGTPLVECDARNFNSAIDALIRLVSHLIADSALEATT